MPSGYWEYKRRAFWGRFLYIIKQNMWEKIELPNMEMDVNNLHASPAINILDDIALPDIALPTILHTAEADNVALLLSEKEISAQVLNVASATADNIEQLSVLFSQMEQTLCDVDIVGVTKIQNIQIFLDRDIAMTIKGTKTRAVIKLPSIDMLIGVDISLNFSSRIGSALRANQLESIINNIEMGLTNLRTGIPTKISKIDMILNNMNAFLHTKTREALRVNNVVLECQTINGQVFVRSATVIRTKISGTLPLMTTGCFLHASTVDHLRIDSLLQQLSALAVMNSCEVKHALVVGTIDNFGCYAKLDAVKAIHPLVVFALNQMNSNVYCQVLQPIHFLIDGNLGMISSVSKLDVATAQNLFIDNNLPQIESVSRVAQKQHMKIADYRNYKISDLYNKTITDVIWRYV